MRLKVSTATTEQFTAKDLQSSIESSFRVTAFGAPLNVRGKVQDVN